MRRRILEALGVAVVITALGIFLQGVVSGQAPATSGGAAGAPAAKAEPAPTLPGGLPDLQGIWYDEFDTPFERPAQQADKEFFTEDERKARDARNSGDVGRNQRFEKGSVQDVAGAYNAVFNSVRPTGRRTSLVVDPPNGRVPALTPATQERNRIDQEFRLALLQLDADLLAQIDRQVGLRRGDGLVLADKAAEFFGHGHHARFQGRVGRQGQGVFRVRPQTCTRQQHDSQRPAHDFTHSMSSGI